MGVLAELEVDKEKFEIAKQESSDNAENFDMYQEEDIVFAIDTINGAFATIQQDVDALSKPPSADEEQQKDIAHKAINQRLVRQQQEEMNEKEFLDLQENFDLIIDDLFDVQDM